MSFLEALRGGALGVTLDVPASYEVLADEDNTANVIDREHDVGWYFFSAPRLELDLEQLESQRRDARNYARHLFDEMRSTEAPPSNNLRIFVSCEKVTVGGTPALSILHRMALEPTKEIVMGHLLVPTGEGLFEARWLTRDGLTGMRESVLLMKALEADPDADPEMVAAGIEFDDPRHDDTFPQHALSRARAAERWIRDASGLRVTTPARPFSRGEVLLKELGCALVPPPRFTRHAANKRFALFCRVSLATTDGLQYFSIQRRRGTDVAEMLDDRTHELIRADKMLLKTKEIRPAPSGVDACLIADADHGTATARYVSVAVREKAGTAALMTIIGTPSDPVDDLVAELAVAGRTYRVARPWWKVW